MSEHTKTPWAVDQSRHHVCIWDSEGGVRVHYHRGLSSGVEPEHAANARHIVHCVNNHERLVEALAKLAIACDSKLVSQEIEYIKTPLDEARTLLAQLQAGKGGE